MMMMMMYIDEGEMEKLNGILAHFCKFCNGIYWVRSAMEMIISTQDSLSPITTETKKVNSTQTLINHRIYPWGKRV